VVAIAGALLLEIILTIALRAHITYQDAALGMLTQSPRLNAALTMLIPASMSDKFRNIPLIGVPKYLDFLKARSSTPPATRASSAGRCAGTRKRAPRRTWST
jgi:hypothetical protein